MLPSVSAPDASYNFVDYGIDIFHSFLQVLAVVSCNLPDEMNKWADRCGETHLPNQSGCTAGIASTKGSVT